MDAHENGDPVRALLAFETALALAPGNVQASSACATLLFELARPQAALACLKTVEQQLLADAEGATNLAIAASACGEREAAKNYLDTALLRDAGHARALHHLALIHAQDGQWHEAIELATRCLAAAPHQDGAWITVADMLLGARRHAEAAAHLDKAVRQFPGHALLSGRLALALALCGDFEQSDPLLASLAGMPSREQLPAGDARTLFSRHAFDALHDCDWREQDRLLALVRHELSALRMGVPSRDMRQALVCGPLLPLDDDEMQQIARATWDVLVAQPTTPGRPFSAADVLRRQGPIRIGIAARDLRDEAATAELAAQLALYDSARFEFYIYAPTPQPQAVLAQALAPHRVIEIAHFNDNEAILRIRLDRLDIWLDLTFGSLAWRPGIAARRVAPVQVQHPGWHGQDAQGPFEYTLSDVFMHPASGTDNKPRNALVRLPHTCWPASLAPAGTPGLTRRQAGFPADALVLCAFAPALHIDAHSFGVWMRVLAALPDAVLWLPPLGRMAQANLRREAQTAGIKEGRLCFATASTREERLDSLALADLFMDTLRINARQDLLDALRMGVPGISCAGSGMAARAGGSILLAAGLGDCVADTEAAYVDAVLRLGRDRAVLQQLRERVKAEVATAPLFDLPARVREFEAAWIWMADRARAGWPPESVDLPAP
ncbi:tetratricopeptide repeat protein [Polaromonas sp.]|uniref:O-linked N-acetylglucosamine transferase family protein n=1 Tax=Polaromonas sp. TaxID=1869339 RepID=UPI0037529E42